MSPEIIQAIHERGVKIISGLMSVQVNFNDMVCAGNE